MDWYNKNKRNSVPNTQSPAYPTITNTGGVSPYSNQRLPYFNGAPNPGPVLNSYTQAKPPITHPLIPPPLNLHPLLVPVDRSSYFLSQYPLYCCDWTYMPQSDIDNIALSTYNEGYTNKLQVIHGLSYGKEFTEAEDSLNDPLMNPRQSRRPYDEMSKNLIEGFDFHKELEISIDYPITNLQWDPAMKSNSQFQRLAASSEVLRLYKAEYDNTNPNESQLTQTHILANNTSGNTLSSNSNLSTDDINTFPPVTSFDWNKNDPNLIITSSVDTTCTVWDLHRSHSQQYTDSFTSDTATVKTQLIAHDSEVFDVKYIHDTTNIFASVGNDGSMRMFDLRSLEHSTIIYEPTSPPQPPAPTNNSFINNSIHSKALLKLATSNIDQHHLATIGVNSNQIIIIDMRMPGLPVATLDGSLGGINNSPINLISWHPSSNYLLTGGDDCQALIWDCNKIHQPKSNPNDINNANNVGIRIDTPILAHDEDLEVNNACWRSDQGDWIGVVSGKGFQAVQL